MTRKHYNAIAAALRSSNAPMDTIYSVADALRGTNDRFDRAKFIDKCLEGPTMEQRANRGLP